MAVLFDFVLELMKIAVLASIYASLIVVVIIFVTRQRSASWLSRISESKSRLWFKTSLLISLLLFVYMFTYWGDHGLGDNARVPVGHGKSVEQSDGAITSIRAKGFEYKTLTIGDFAITKSFLVAKKEAENNKDSLRYLAWNLKTNSVDFFTSYSSLDNFARSQGISLAIRFSSFRAHYKYYWNGWRLLLLP